MFKSALIVFNISKQKNIGGLMRTANAMGVSELILVGRKKKSTYGHCGTESHIPQKHFFQLEDAVCYLRENDYSITGIEISQQSVKIEQHPFTGNTAFLPGNEGTGLTEKQRKLCDQLVYIGQFGNGASLNVNVAAGIVLHHYSIWANFETNDIESYKFISRASTLV